MCHTEIMDKGKLKTEIQNGENIHLSKDSSHYITISLVWKHSCLFIVSKWNGSIQHLIFYPSHVWNPAMSLCPPRGSKPHSSEKPCSAGLQGNSSLGTTQEKMCLDNNAEAESKALSNHTLWTYKTPHTQFTVYTVDLHSSVLTARATCLHHWEVSLASV